MNLTDLRTVLNERSADSTDEVLHHLRLSGVREKVVARRRNRAAVTAIFAAVAVLGIGTVAVLRTPSATPPPATPAPSVDPTRTIEGFPEYAQGARVVAAKRAALPAREVSLTFVPNTLDLVFFDRCVATPGLLIETRVNGHLHLSGSCGGGSWTSDPAGLAADGVEVGRPATVTMTVTGGWDSGAEEVPVPDNGYFALAVGERVPFASYPLPSRPATLTPLRTESFSGAPGAGTASLGADLADPNRPQRLTVTWGSVRDLEMVAQTPGLLHLRINGVEVGTGEWWDYEQGGYGVLDEAHWEQEFGLKLRPGQQVTIEAVPEHMTGDWRVIFVPAEGPTK